MVTKAKSTRESVRLSHNDIMNQNKDNEIVNWDNRKSVGQWL